jgi:hypothetical protein
MNADWKIFLSGLADIGVSMNEFNDVGAGGAGGFGGKFLFI